MFRFISISLVLCAATACVEYNEACTAPVDKPREVVAKLKDPVFIDKPNARHANNAFGQAAADAFKSAFGEEAQIGVINSGDIRAEGYCKARTALRGDIKRADVYEVLLFDNLVYSLEVTEKQLVAALQHSVASLTPAGTTPQPQEIAAPPARFLQVSKDVQMTVNCALASGQRMTDLKVAGKTISLTAPSETTKYKIAMPEFLMLGGDGYAPFKEAYADGAGVFRQTPRSEKEALITETYLFENFAKKNVELVTEQRVIMSGCAVPVPPAN